MKSSFDTSKNIFDYSHSNESTSTSCSVISANCIEYDSDIESDDSIHFYRYLHIIYIFCHLQLKSLLFANINTIIWENSRILVNGS